MATGDSVDAAPAARGLAGPVAGAPEDPREDVGLAVGHVRVGVPALSDETDVLGDVGVGRAGPLAVNDPMKVIRVRRVSWVHEMVWIPGLGPCFLHGDTAVSTCDVRRHSASPVRPSIHSLQMGDLRYADAGVDIDEGNRAVSLIRRTIASTHTAQVLGGIGAFSGLFALEPGSPNGRVLASSTDSVGTKVKVAIATGRHRGIGIDLVNHCVNDILCCGAEPLFFLDYYATGKLVPEHLAELIEGIAEACRSAGCALIGGETAEMPGVYALADYDIAGFIVGSVEARRSSTGAASLPAMSCSPCRAAGCTPTATRWCANRRRARAAVGDDPPGTDTPLVDLLLEPHRSYFHAIRRAAAR